MKTKKHIIAIAFGLMAFAAWAMTPVGPLVNLHRQAPISQTPDDSLVVDSTTFDNTDMDSVKKVMENLQLQLADTMHSVDDPISLSTINMFIRSYPDSVVLRWAPEDYVSWKHLNRVGYNVYRIRMDGKSFDVDTLALALKPLTMEQMKAKYAEQDSLAMMVIGLMYGVGGLKVDDIRYEPGSMGSLLALHDDQQTSFGFAVLLSEWRRDLAEDMALRIVDRNVKKGQKYNYIVQAVRGDSVAGLRFKSAYIENVELLPFTPRPLDVTITDSLVENNCVNLRWRNDAYSCFEVERRRKGTDSWTRLTERPYMPMPEADLQDYACLYNDGPLKPGTYEYRVLAHDLFGDMTMPSPVHQVHVGDNIPPSTPKLKGIFIERPENDPSAKVLAHISWSKATLEPDFIGYMPLYYNERVNGKEWKTLCPKLLPPTDTTCTVDVTGLPSGMFVLAAYDDADNVSTTMPYQIRITDMKAPEPPTYFNAVVSRTGIATLTWDQPLSDDVAHYDLFFVNDTTHQPTQRNTGELTDDFYQDTLALDVNQRYIYYKVRAVDYSGNFGEFTPWLQVERPSLVPPSVCHLDTAWNDEKGIHMNWVIGRDAALDFHNIYRRLAGENEWRLLDIIYQRDILATGDTVMVLCDKPAYNRHKRYEYAIESFNNTGISSGLSLAYSTLYKGPDIIDVPVKLIGTYEAKNGETRLAWDAKPPKSEGDYYYCVYRRTEGDGIFRFLLSTKANEPMLSDYNTQPGQEAEYYVIVRFDNGRVSQRSNVVRVKAIQ